MWLRVLLFTSIANYKELTFKTTFWETIYWLSNVFASETLLIILFFYFLANVEPSSETLGLLVETMQYFRASDIFRRKFTSRAEEPLGTYSYWTSSRSVRIPSSFIRHKMPFSMPLSFLSTSHLSDRSEAVQASALLVFGFTSVLVVIENQKAITRIRHIETPVAIINIPEYAASLFDLGPLWFFFCSVKIVSITWKPPSVTTQLCL